MRILKSPNASDRFEIVLQHVRKEIMDPSDKLPALSSISGCFARKMNDTYLAGLWTKNLHCQLCWTLDELSQTPTP